MDPLGQKIIDIIDSSLIKEDRKKILTTFLEKNGVLPEFFELLKEHILGEAEERKILFMETLEEWNTIYTTLLKELHTAEEENDSQLSQKLLTIDQWDSDARQLALQKYSNQQTALYLTYQKKIAHLGAQHTEKALRKILPAQITV